MIRKRIPNTTEGRSRSYLRYINFFWYFLKTERKDGLYPGNNPQNALFYEWHRRESNHSPSFFIAKVCVVTFRSNAIANPQNPALQNSITTPIWFRLVASVLRGWFLSETLADEERSETLRPFWGKLDSLSLLSLQPSFWNQIGA